MDDFTLVYSYSQAQAIADGVLIDVTAQAKETGFKLHTVVTDNLYHRYIVPSAGLEGEGQSVAGRLHDTFGMLLAAASKQPNSARVETDVRFLMAPGRQEKVRVIAVVGPGDEGEAVMTIMLPGDD
jgi:hypothetical protein